MIEGTTKMELDAKEGRGYSSGIRMCEERKNGEIEERKRNKREARTDKQGDNPLMRVMKKECKCGSKENYRQISLLRCPWKGLSKEEVAQKYEKRMSKKVVPLNCDESTVDPTTEPRSEATEKGKRSRKRRSRRMQRTSTVN
jgi:hypothetical protein